LTLRAVGGLSTAEIARALLVPEATMAQRISRAKQRIKAAGAGFELPPPAEQAQRLGVVLHVLYLVFNEGHTTFLAVPLLRRPQAGWRARLMHGAPIMLDPRARASRPMTSPIRSSSFGSQLAPRAEPWGNVVAPSPWNPLGPSENLTPGDAEPGDRTRVSTLKHFCLNCNETNRRWLAAIIDPIAHRQSDLLAFDIAIERS
jgi:sigma-70-like protein